MTLNHLSKMSYGSDNIDGNRKKPFLKTPTKSERNPHVHSIDNHPPEYYN